MHCIVVQVLQPPAKMPGDEPAVSLLPDSTAVLTAANVTIKIANSSTAVMRWGMGIEIDGVPLLL